MSTAANALIPWTDRSGRFSPLRAFVFAAVLAPGLWLGWLGFAGQLGARPVTAAILDTGGWAVRLLLLALLVSPLRAVLRRSELIGVRRMLGLAALGYVLIHATLYIVDQKYDLLKVATEIALRTYLTIGFTALLGLAVLGATSTDGMVRRLGAQKWNRLHGGVYLLTALALLHFFLQRKLEVFEPALMAGLFLWLMGWRWLRRRGAESGVAALAVLAPVAAGAAMLLEAAYMAIRYGVPFDRFLLANLDFDYVIRPGWWVLGAGIAFAVLAAAMAWLRPAPARPRRPASSAPPSSGARSSAATTDGP